ncbi:hypothetical protein AB0P37_08480 [Streptomyces antimycoticus]
MNERVTTTVVDPVTLEYVVTNAEGDVLATVRMSRDRARALGLI